MAIAPISLNSFFNEDDIEPNQAEIEPGTWMKASFIISSVEAEIRKALIIHGEAVYAASPIERTKTLTLVAEKRLTQNEINEINSEYEKIEKEFCPRSQLPLAVKRLLIDTIPISATCYSVGFANCVKIDGRSAKTGKPKSLLYDIGIDYRSKDEVERAAFFRHDANFFHPDSVVLSHWDADHIFGCVYLDDEAFYVPWVAPSYLNRISRISVGARRLACYLHRIKKLNLVYSPGKDILSLSRKGDLPSIGIYQGATIRGQDQNVTAENKEGLALLIDLGIFAKKPELPYVLMCGDVPYLSLPPNCQNAINECALLIIPHHGCTMDTSALSSVAHQRRSAISCTRMNHQQYTYLNSYVTICRTLSCNQGRMCNRKPCCFSILYDKKKGKWPAYAALPKTNPCHIHALKSKGFRVFPTGQTTGAVCFDFCSQEIFLVKDVSKRAIRQYAL